VSSDPLQELLKLNTKASLFPPTSRYYGLDTATLEMPDGRVIVYIKRRFVPQPERFEAIEEHIVTQDDRVDNLAARYIGDPEQYWRLCDANGVMSPEELTKPIGKKILITLPEGMQGGRNV
jgi:hypothetical protein